MKRPPLNQLSIANLYDLELINTSNERIEFYLFGTLTESKSGLIATATTVAIKLDAKERKQFKAGDLPKTPDISYPNSDNRYKDALLRKGSLPDGNYTICVYAKQSATHDEMGNDCIEQEISIQSESELTLLSPDNNAEIGLDDLVIFSWSALGKLEGSYKLKIVELKENESPENAIFKNKAFFEKEEIRTTSFQYPATAQKFESGKYYAWVVTIGKISSIINRFTISNSNKLCSNLKVVGEALSLEREKCCFKLTLINKNSGKENQPYGFNIILPPPITITAISNTPTEWSQSPSTINSNTSSVTWQSKNPFANREVNLATVCVNISGSGVMYVKYEWLDKNKKIICKDSIKVTCPASEEVYKDTVCSTNIVSNGNFILGNVPGVMPAGNIQNWSKAYGTPQVINDPNEGCWDIGNIGISGNKISGQAIMQILNPTNKIIQGKKYRFSIAVKFLAQNSGADYVKIRMIAFNNNLPAGTNHPSPGTDIAIIGVSSKIKECAGWTIVTLPVWIANKNFDKIAINAENNEQTAVSYAYIDNIQVCDVTEEDLNCNEIALDAQGNPIIPPNLVPYLDASCPPIIEEVELENGNVNDLYGGNGVDTWYQNFNDLCGSVGGTIPDEVNNYNCDDSLRALGINMTCDEMNKFLNQEVQVNNEDLKITPVPPLTPNLECERVKFIPNPNLPFGGRDIIFVHGLKLDHLCDRENNVPGADGIWPNDTSEFFSGYFKDIADTAWSDHIWNFLRNRNAANPSSNRYLIVDYNCNQRLEYGVSAMLGQIREAMETGRGVIPSATNKTTKCFGKEYVIISHSTGGLITDVMLSIMKKSTVDPIFTAKWGDLGPLLKGCKTHIALHPALSGSNMAKIFVLGNTNLWTSLFLSHISMKSACQNPTWVTPNTVSNSILIDLMPQYAQTVWGPYIASVPVDVLITAGGQKGSIIDKGMDDGVLSMDCQCGNPTLHSNAPTTYTPTSLAKVFDMGIPLGRAVRFFLDQKESGGQISAGCTPFLSPTGMVQPVESIQPNTLSRYPRHYSFIQTASDHMTGPRGHGGDVDSIFTLNDPLGTTGYKLPNKDYPTKHGPNWEEVRAITDNYVYSSGLVNSAVSNMVYEEMRGLKFSFTIRYPWVKNWRLVWVSKTFEFWIWKRKYHLLQNTKNKTECDYVYDYVLR